MIKVLYSKRMPTIEVKGHALFASAGNDIVCSAVSILTQYVAEIIENEGLGTYEKKKGYLKIIVRNETEVSKVLIDYLIKSLISISNDYPRNLKVEVR